VVDRPRLHELSDTALLDEHARGDVDAFGELARRHRDRLWAVALRTLGDREEAADAVQDALLAALRASSGRGIGAAEAVETTSSAFRGEAAVTTWLHRIVVNACIDRIRRRTVRQSDPLPPYELPDPRPDAFSAADTSIDVTAALAQLPAEQRAALVLVDMYGWSVEAAAEVLDCPVGTVKSRCARGRARLLPLLRGRAVPSGNQEPADAVSPLTHGQRLSSEPAPVSEGGDTSP
jgi:RNA polymerase sigma-70 factor (ECF subfamily)